MTPTAQRRIAHLDMDAFFASVELLRYPDLCGQPVVIGGDDHVAPLQRADGSRRYTRLREYQGRGVITTATYEARALGVSSAMGLMTAARLAPEAILLPVDFAAYRFYSQRFKMAVAEITPQIENRGIDEIYIDLSHLPEDSVTLAARIKTAVRQATGLSCSIAVAPNKLLAKIGSDLDKPDGLTILASSDLERRIWPLPVRKINGVGPKAESRLAKLGIATIGELAHSSEVTLTPHFGQSTARWLLAAANGRDEHPLIIHSEPKSISRETTFPRDLDARQDRELLGAIFTDLCQRVAADLRRQQCVGRTIGIKLRFADFRTVTRDQTLTRATDDARLIRRAAGDCLRRVPLDLRLRLLGVRVATLSSSARRASAGCPQQGELALFVPPEN